MSVSQFAGLPLLHCYLSPKLCGEPVTPDSTQSIANLGHQESWSPMSGEKNKDDATFDKNMGFVVENLTYHTCLVTHL